MKVTRGFMKDRYLKNAAVLTACDFMQKTGGMFLNFGDSEFVKGKFLKLMSS
jgi:hypothetical protein